MALKLPYIPEINSASELLDVVANSELLQERMTLLLKLQDDINNELKRWQEFGDVQAYRDLVDTENAASKAKRFDADAYSDRTIKVADSILGKARATEKQAEDFHKSVRTSANAREEKLDLWEQEITKREQAVARDLVNSAAFVEEAKRLLKEANETRATYEAKLAKMREIAD